jgi:hypothetical protein
VQKKSIGVKEEILFIFSLFFRSFVFLRQGLALAKAGLELTV